MPIFKYTSFFTSNRVKNKLEGRERGEEKEGKRRREEKWRHIEKFWLEKSPFSFGKKLKSE